MRGSALPPGPPAATAGHIRRTRGLGPTIGRARVLEIVLGAGDFDASTAERYGWINRALPDAQLDTFVTNLAQRLATFDKAALGEAKQGALPNSDDLKASQALFPCLLRELESYPDGPNILDSERGFLPDKLPLFQGWSPGRSSVMPTMPLSSGPICSALTSSIALLFCPSWLLRVGQLMEGSTAEAEDGRQNCRNQCCRQGIFRCRPGRTGLRPRRRLLDTPRLYRLKVSVRCSAGTVRGGFPRRTRL